MRWERDGNREQNRKKLVWCSTWCTVHDHKLIFPNGIGIVTKVI